jgi:trehalose 2-sulfotransferase
MGAGWVRDFVGPEYDESREPPRLGPTRAYAVCSTPRSGSGLLCRGLAATGELGTPLEYLNPVLREIFAERWGCGPGLEAYVDALHGRRTAANGVFGIKVHWAQLAAAAAEAGVAPAELLERVAPAGRVRTRRGDRVAQAVSYWRAGRSGVWSLAAGVEHVDDAPYDFDGIAACYAEIERSERDWDALVPGAETVAYEELASDYAGTMRRVASTLGAPEVEVGPPSTRRLADERSAALAERFRADLA